jgi:hypothetical protein
VTTNGLGRRIDALEQIRRDVERRGRRPEIERLAARYQVDPDRIEEIFEQITAMRAAGLDTEQVHARLCAERGWSLEDFRERMGRIAREMEEP